MHIGAKTVKSGISDIQLPADKGERIDSQVKVVKRNQGVKFRPYAAQAKSSRSPVIPLKQVMRSRSDSSK